ncbi:MAG: hypothetical protein RLZZ612_1091 [Pseudomonadota bacterium]
MIEVDPLGADGSDLFDLVGIPCGGNGAIIQ